ncbi:hypothetical protein [uncultured Olegusella sp.]|uniref:hypothetical protein n=1 Tax=uncultured Olegusella sp. TaxID=1979846 RepID=UPI002620EEFC|nr:hypothetical protein [uncultured Olegusella sp.]
MAWPELTYSRYQQLGGTADEQTFTACLKPCSAAVKAICHPNEPKSWQQEAAEQAITAAIDYDTATGASHGAEGGGSVRIGDFSLGAVPDTAAWKTGIKSAIADTLVGTGLLCQVMY